MQVWIFNPRNADIEVYRNREDAIRDFCESNHADNLEELQKMYPHLDVEDDYIYLDDGGSIRRTTLNE